MPLFRASATCLSKLLRSAVVFSCALSAPKLLAQTAFSGAIGAGYEYDSNVSVDELEQASNLGDQALVSSLDLAVDTEFNDSTEASLSYGYSRVDYQTFDALSRETHMLGANLSADIEPVTVGLNYFYISALLDGSDFLTYQRISPSVSGFLSKRWFLRGAYVHGEKEVSRRQGRNAINDGLELDSYYFWRGLRRYFNIGYTYRMEDSQAPRFDYTAHQMKVRFVQRIELVGKLATLELGARYEVRDYSSPTLSIGERRDDDRMRVKLELEVPLGTRFQWLVYTGYSDYASNLPSADYDQTLIGSRLEFLF